jgi:hypothetical protein
MLVISKRWDPDRRDISLEVPEGSVLLRVRMSTNGDCQASFAVPDDGAALKPFTMAVCVENEKPLEGSPEDWRHVGTWEYASGRVAHAFQSVKGEPEPIEPPPLPRKRRTKAEMREARRLLDSESGQE